MTNSYHAQTPLPSRNPTDKSGKTSPRPNKLTSHKLQTHHRNLSSQKDISIVPNIIITTKPKTESNAASSSSTQKNPNVFVPNGPISPAFAKTRYKDFLSPYELTEINGYHHIYYISRNSRNINSGIGSANNFGFDIPPTCNYKIQIGDHIAYRYEIVRSFGKGAFGEVIQCLDHKTNTNVAIKILVNTPVMRRQGAIEVTNLRLVSSRTSSKYVEKVIDSFTFREHMCIVTEILGNSLLNYILSNKFSASSSKQVKSIIFDMVSGLFDIHRSNIIHADIKPENILFLTNSDSHVKIIDFGSSCAVGRTVYNYLQSRYYRAPEVILGIPYNTAIDMWSLGCILCEIITGKPIFNGINEKDQLKKIIEAIGLPPQSMLTQCTRKKDFFGPDGKLFGNPQPYKNRLSSTLRIGDSQMLDFINKCLAWEPSKRLTAEKALQHSWLAQNSAKK